MVGSKVRKRLADRLAKINVTGLSNIISLSIGAGTIVAGCKGKLVYFGLGLAVYLAGAAFGPDILGGIRKSVIKRLRPKLKKWDIDGVHDDLPQSEKWPEVPQYLRVIYDLEQNSKLMKEVRSGKTQDVTPPFHAEM